MNVQLSLAHVQAREACTMHASGGGVLLRLSLLRVHYSSHRCHLHHKTNLI